MLKRLKFFLSKKEINIATEIVTEKLKQKTIIIECINKRIDFYKREEPRQENTAMIINELTSLRDQINGI